MLKCPFHLPYLEELFTTFPDATVVWTHRDPVECIGSACSLYYTLAAMATEVDSIDKNAIGQGVMEYTRRSLDMAQKALRKLEPVEPVLSTYAIRIMSRIHVARYVVY